jgi:hypothetical protein
VIKVTLASGQAGDAAIMGQDPAADIAVIRPACPAPPRPARYSIRAARWWDAVLVIGDLLDVAVRRRPACGTRGDRPSQAW